LITVTLSGDTEQGYNNPKIKKLDAVMRVRHINPRYIESIQPFKLRCGKVITKIVCTNKKYLVKESITDIRAMIK
tara:strand:+ start:1208 stop:1432 length:225 start_codon:yes stop_codon:yes gene_type:complete